MAPVPDVRDWRKQLLALYQAVEAGRCDVDTFRRDRAAVLAAGSPVSDAKPGERDHSRS